MCLDRLDPTIKRKSGKGYKVVSKRDGKYLSEFLHPDGRGASCKFKFPVGKWVTDKNTDIIVVFAGDGASYPSGFHIFKTKRAAERWGLGFDFLPYRLVIIKVEYKDVVATGKLNGLSAVVARQLINKGEVD